MKIVHGNSQVLRGLTQAEWFGYSITEEPAYSGEVATPGLVNGDLTYTAIDLAGVINNARITVSESPLAEGHSFESLTPEVATVSADGYIARVSTGLAEIKITTPVGAQIYRREMESLGSASYSQATDYAIGSLNKHLLTQVSALVLGKSAGQAMQVLWSITSSNIDTPVGTMNPDNFAAAYNWNACSMLTSDRADDRYPLILISDRHAITANHTRPAIGSKAVYKRPNGTYQTVTVSASSQLVGDSRLVCFAEAVTGITPYKLPPAGWVETYVPSALSSPAPYMPTCQTPVLVKGMHDQNGAWKSYVGVFGASSLQFVQGLANVINALPSQHQALSTWTPLAFIGGDSGSPIFLPVNGELVLLGVITSGGGGFQSMYGSPVEVVLEGMMTTQAGSAYAPTYADFSEFTDYS